MRGEGSTFRALLVLASVAVLAAAASTADGSPRHPGAAPQVAFGQLSTQDRLARVRTTLAELRAREAALRSERSLTRMRADAARRSLAVAQRRLAQRLRTLYVEGSAHPLEIVLGATSFSAAVTELESLERTARHDRAWIERSRSLRSELAGLAGRLAARAAEVRRLRRSAEVAERALVAIAAEQTRMAHERKARAASRTLAAAPANDAAPSGEAEAAPAQRAAPAPAAPHGSGTLVVVATAYALPGFTATGSPVGPGTVAVDPAVIPLGSTLSIPGYGIAVAADTGPSIRGARIDVWFPTIERAHAWGTRTVEVMIFRS